MTVLKVPGWLQAHMPAIPSLLPGGAFLILLDGWWIFMWLVCILMHVLVSGNSRRVKLIKTLY